MTYVGWKRSGEPWQAPYLFRVGWSFLDETKYVEVVFFYRRYMILWGE